MSKTEFADKYNENSGSFFNFLNKLFAALCYCKKYFAKK